MGLIVFVVAIMTAAWWNDVDNDGFDAHPTQFAFCVAGWVAAAVAIVLKVRSERPTPPRQPDAASRAEREEEPEDLRVEGDPVPCDESPEPEFPAPAGVEMCPQPWCYSPRHEGPLTHRMQVAGVPSGPDESPVMCPGPDFAGEFVVPTGRLRIDVTPPRPGRGARVRKRLRFILVTVATCGLGVVAALFTLADTTDRIADWMAVGIALLLEFTGVCLFDWGPGNSGVELMGATAVLGIVYYVVRDIVRGRPVIRWISAPALGDEIYLRVRTPPGDLDREWMIVRARIQGLSWISGTVIVEAAGHSFEWPALEKLQQAYAAEVTR